MATSKESNVIISALVNQNGELGIHRASRFDCTATVLSVGKKDFVIKNPEVAIWLYGVFAALEPVSEKIKGWIGMSEQSQVNSHFPMELCQHCPTLVKRMGEISQRTPIVLIDVWSTDILTGRAGEFENSMLREMYGTKNKKEWRNN